MFFLLLAVSCSESSSFDREVWMQHPDVNDRYNPRLRMVQDVIKNHLNPGMSRMAVIDLLGIPYKEGLEVRLPADIVLPDSLKHFETPKAEAAYYDFFKSYGKSIMLMKYAVGWSIIDPIFLVIELDRKGFVVRYWEEES
jgi:hypothetical protein